MSLLLLVNETIIEHVLKRLNILYKIKEEVLIQNYDITMTAMGIFYLEEHNLAPSMMQIIDISLQDAWKLGQFQSCYQLKRCAIEINNGKIIKSSSQELYAYFKRENQLFEDSLRNIREMEAYVTKNRQLSMCDIYLMIPGKLKNEEQWKHIKRSDNEIFDVFRENINYSIQEEYNQDYARQIDRICVGMVELEIELDVMEGKRYVQTGLVEIVKHDMGLCILEIMVHNCYIGGNKLLNYYCGNILNYIYNGKKYKLDEFLNLFSIRRYGNKRSMVFGYGDIPKQAIINALANEEYPMGKIGGTFAKKLENDNLALYDTAKVYASEVSMIECCGEITDAVRLLPENRIAYQVIEIFFVELILFQDAAIDKVYSDIIEEQERQYVMDYSEDDAEKFEQLSFDMSRAIKFADYKQFNFPTTRESAQRIADNFGINDIYDKYEKNKELLSAMIAANKRQNENRENAVRNRFLLVISFIVTAQPLRETLEAMLSDNPKAGMAYVCAIMFLAIGYLGYTLFMKFYKEVIKKKDE